MVVMTVDEREIDVYALTVVTRKGMKRGRYYKRLAEAKEITSPLPYFLLGKDVSPQCLMFMKSDG